MANVVQYGVAAVTTVIVVNRQDNKKHTSKPNLLRHRIVLNHDPGVFPKRQPLSAVWPVERLSP